MRVNKREGMDKKQLFSIGRLAKLTGVHIQSLRYYEALSILRPAYIDPDSGYRYYTYSQTRIVVAIQYCVEVGIPLKEFKRFISESDGWIDYAGLLKYGKQISQEKMKRIQERLDFLDDVQQDMIHAENCHIGQFTKACFQEKLCWVIPYEGTQTDSTLHAAMHRLILEVERQGLHSGFYNGQLLCYRNQKVDSYLFIDLREDDSILKKYSQIMRIPGGEYLCTVSKESCIKRAPEIFPELFRSVNNQIVVEVELFTGQYNYFDPVFELRCSFSK